MRVEHLVGEATTNLRRNTLLVVGAVLAVFISLLLGFLALVVGQVARNTVNAWGDDVQIVAFLHDDPGSAGHVALQNQVNTWDEVDELRYVSKAQALEEFRRIFPRYERLSQELTADTLPASIRIKLADPADHDLVVERFEQLEEVQRVLSPAEIVDNWLKLSRILNSVMLALGVALGISAIVLISNTVRMAIYARRDEISIMKLVGASNWFVRAPFVVEGMIEGLVGGLVAVAAGWVAYVLFRRGLSTGTNALGVDWLQTELSPGFLWGRGLLILAFGGLTGAIGSFLGLRKYLRV